MSDYNKELGKRIYRARKDLGLTMRELGKKVSLGDILIIINV